MLLPLAFRQVPICLHIATTKLIFPGTYLTLKENAKQATPDASWRANQPKNNNPNELMGGHCILQNRKTITLMNSWVAIASCKTQAFRRVSTEGPPTRTTRNFVSWQWAIITNQTRNLATLGSQDVIPRKFKIEGNC